MSELPGDHDENPASDEPGATSASDVPEQVDEKSQYSEAWSFLKELPFLIVGALIVAVLVKSFLI